MKTNSHLTKQIGFGALLLLLSVLFYTLHYALFHDAHHIFIYLVGDVAFVFIEVLLVTLILHQILSEREKRAMRQKLNMVIGAFFSEVGTPLLNHFRSFDKSADRIADRLDVDADWSHEQFERMREVLRTHDYEVDSRAGDLKTLQESLISKRPFLLRLLENPNLLEHERFTELLWAVFHLADELSHRPTMEGLPQPDYEHLAGDIKRAYALLIREWLSHLDHLKASYPYLFSLAVRTNPFNPTASVELQ